LNKYLSTSKFFKTKFLSLSPAVLAVFGIIALVPIFSENLYIIELLTLSLVYCIFAISWDILSGYTEQMNFGHAFFIGGAGYIAALLNLRLGVSPTLSIPISGVMAGCAGLGIGYLTLRLKGPYFALATIVFSTVLYKLCFVAWRISGGEEGLSGVATLTKNVKGDFYISLSIVLVSFIILSFFAHSKYGLLLKSTRFNEDVAEASGINTAYYKIVAFALSGFFAGIGGALYTHTHMQIGPSMLSGYLCVLIVLLAMVGGMGTLVGPFLGAFILSLFNEWLRIIEVYRIVVFTGVLILLIYLNPMGLANSTIFKRYRILNRIFFGRDS
jgi:branched-chain amino acid transport system permease protein